MPSVSGETLREIVYDYLPDPLGWAVWTSRTDIVNQHAPLISPISSVSAEGFAVIDWRRYGTARNVVTILELLSAWINHHFTLRQPSGIFRFIEEHSFLAPLQMETYDAVSRHFGAFPKIALDLVSDPEVPDRSELVAFIQTELSPDDALKRLDQLEEDWWLDALARSRQKFSINLEFV